MVALTVNLFKPLVTGSQAFPKIKRIERKSQYPPDHILPHPRLYIQRGRACNKDLYVFYGIVNELKFLPALLNILKLINKQIKFPAVLFEIGRASCRERV